MSTPVALTNATVLLSSFRLSTMEQSTTAAIFVTNLASLTKTKEDKDLHPGSIAGHAAAGFIIVVLVIVLAVLCYRKRVCSCCKSNTDERLTDNIISVSVHSSRDSILSAIVIEPLSPNEERKSRDPSKTPEGTVDGVNNDNYLGRDASCKMYENVPVSVSESKPEIQNISPCNMSTGQLVQTGPRTLMVFANDLNKPCPDLSMPHTDPESPSYSTIDSPLSNNKNNSNIIPPVVRLSSDSSVSASDYENVPEKLKDISSKKEHGEQYDNNLTQGYFSMEMGTPKQPRKELGPSDTDDGTVNQVCVETEPASYCNVEVNTPEQSHDNKVSEKVDDADDDDDDAEDYLHPISSKKLKKIH